MQRTNDLHSNECGVNCHETMLRDESAMEQFDEIAEGFENAWSNNRDRMVREIEALKLTRPGLSS
jgi:hypothetical protein